MEGYTRESAAPNACVMLRDMSRKVKAIKSLNGEASRAPQSRSLERKKSKRGDDPLPRQMLHRTQTDKVTQDDISDDISGRLELLEARSRSLLDDRMTESEAEQHDFLELISKQKWQHVLVRLDETPELASQAHDMDLGRTDGHDAVITRALPIHKTLTTSPPHYIVEALLAAYPDAAQIPDEKWGRLPIHMALIGNVNSQIVKLLMVSYQRSIHIAEKKDGRIPLHLACLFGSPYEVSLLLTADENTIYVRDRHGKTPIEITYESSGNPHREAILKRLKDKSRVLVSPERAAHRSQQSTPASPKTTKTHNKGKSNRWNWRKKGNDPRSSVSLLPELDCDNDTPVRRNVRSQSMNSERSMENPSTFRSSRSLFRKSRTKSMGHSLSDSREKGFLSRFQRTAPREATRANQFSATVSGPGTEIGDERTVASMPTIFPFTPSRNIAQFSAESAQPDIAQFSAESAQPEALPVESSSGEANLASFLTKTNFGAHQEADTRKMSQLDASEQNRKTKPRKSTFEEERDEVVSHEESSANQSPSQSSFRPMSTAESVDAAIRIVSQYHSGSSSSVAPRTETSNQITRSGLPEGGNVPILASTPVLSLLTKQKNLEKDFRDMASLPSDSTASTRILLNDSSSEVVDNMHFEQEQQVIEPNNGQSPYLVDYHHQHVQEASERQLSLDKESEIAALETQLCHLDIRKEALTEECNHVSEAILMKRESADKARRRIRATEQKLADLQSKLEREQAALDHAESRMQIQLETLEDHQTKVRSVDEEMNVLLAVKKNLIGR